MCDSKDGIYNRAEQKTPPMEPKAALLAIALLGFGSLTLTGQQAAAPGVFTAAQAQAGRTAYENSCGKCDSRFGQKTAVELINQFQRTASTPIFDLGWVDDDTILNITAYILQMNGARAGSQPLTKTTSAVLNAIVQ
jgi:hypothetical protein